MGECIDKIQNTLVQYKIGNILGRGGYGTVHVLEMVNEPKYAIKIVDLDTPGAREKILAEKNVFKKLKKNKSGVECIDRGINCYIKLEHDDECAYSISDFYDTDLSVYLSKFGPFNKRAFNDYLALELYIYWVKEITRAVGVLHEKGLAHGDIKPNNILLKYSNNQISITDFDAICSSSKCKVDTYTYSYMSPPLFKELDNMVDNAMIQKSDIWALAMTFLSMWFGKNFMADIIEKDNDLSNNPISYKEFYENGVPNTTIQFLSDSCIMDQKEYQSAQKDKLSEDKLTNDIININYVLGECISVIHHEGKLWKDFDWAIQNTSSSFENMCRNECEAVCNSKSNNSIIDKIMGKKN